MAEEPPHQNPPSGGLYVSPNAVFNNTQDYLNWDWKQLMAAVFGRAAVPDGAPGVFANMEPSPESLWDAAKRVNVALDALNTVEVSLQQQIDALAGEEHGAWKGPAAQDFRSQVNIVRAKVLAKINQLIGGTSGENHVVQNLWNNGNDLKWAQHAIQAIDAYYSKWIRDHADLLTYVYQTDIIMANGLTRISAVPGLPEQMAEDMQVVIGTLATRYSKWHVNPAGDPVVTDLMTQPNPDDVPPPPGGGDLPPPPDIGGSDGAKDIDLPPPPDIDGLDDPKLHLPLAPEPQDPTGPDGLGGAPPPGTIGTPPPPAGIDGLGSGGLGSGGLGSGGAGSGLSGLGGLPPPSSIGMPPPSLGRSGIGVGAGSGANRPSPPSIGVPPSAGAGSGAGTGVGTGSELGAADRTTLPQPVEAQAPGQGGLGAGLDMAGAGMPPPMMPPPMMPPGGGSPTAADRPDASGLLGGVERPWSPGLQPTFDGTNQTNPQSAKPEGWAASTETSTAGAGAAQPGATVPPPMMPPPMMPPGAAPGAGAAERPDSSGLLGGETDPWAPGPPGVAGDPSAASASAVGPEEWASLPSTESSTSGVQVVPGAPMVATPAAGPPAQAAAGPPPAAAGPPPAGAGHPGATGPPGGAREPGSSDTAESIEVVEPGGAPAPSSAKPEDWAAATSAPSGSARFDGPAPVGGDDLAAADMPAAALEPFGTVAPSAPAEWAVGPDDVGGLLHAGADGTPDAAAEPISGEVARPGVDSVAVVADSGGVEDKSSWDDWSGVGFLLAAGAVGAGAAGAGFAAQAGRPRGDRRDDDELRRVTYQPKKAADGVPISLLELGNGDEDLLPENEREAARERRAKAEQERLEQERAAEEAEDDEEPDERSAADLLSQDASAWGAAASKTTGVLD